MPHHPTQHLITEPLADVTLHAAALILAAAHRAVVERGSFTMVLAGGQSPRQLYTMLGQGLPCNELQRWQLPLPEECANTELICLPPSTWLFQSDERCVPPNHPDSNQRMIRETLLASAALPPDHFFAMDSTPDNPYLAASQYEERLQLFFANERTTPLFDMMLLGMGDDGHTASLFADDEQGLHECDAWVMARNAAQGKPPGWRITMSLPLLQRARQVLFFVPSATKHQLVQRIVAGNAPTLPAAMVQPPYGDVYWFTTKE
uniref:6-phosphogluconolactonase n=1 Tax=Chlorobium chlorochromatii (strain CaD3) TaxID=340177 RepID=Q3APN1_CHLCH